MLCPNFKPFPVIQTERLILRQINAADTDDIFNHRSNTDVIKYLDRPVIISREEAVHHIQILNIQSENNESVVWGVALKGQQNLIGTIAFHRIDKLHYRAEIGYMLMPPFWRQGFMSEALKAVIQFGFEVMQLHTIEAQINPHNMASAQILEKFNFVKEAHFKENYLFNGKFVDSVVYSLINPMQSNIQSQSLEI